MFKKIVDPSGLSLSVNRVALPSIDSFAETYGTLPDGLDLGYIGEVEGKRMTAVLCKNGATAIARHRFVESVKRTLGSAGYNANAIPQFGDKQVHVPSTISADALPEDCLIGGKYWILWGIAARYFNNRALPYYTIAGNTAGDGTGPVTLDLVQSFDIEVIAAAGNLALSSIFNNVQESTTTTQNKALGIPIIDVPTDHYFWVVFEGEIPANAGGLGLNAGFALKKGVDGALVTTTANAETVGYKRHSGTIDIVILNVPGIRV